MFVIIIIIITIIIIIISRTFEIDPEWRTL